MAQPKDTITNDDPFSWMSTTPGLNQTENTEKPSKSKSSMNDMKNSPQIDDIDNNSSFTNEIIDKPPNKQKNPIMDLNFLFNDDKKTQTDAKAAKPAKEKAIAKKTQTEEEEKKMSTPKCICNESLTYIKAGDCYDGNGIGCDGCGASKSGKVKIYHCNNESSPKHYGGYDLCKECATKPSLNDVANAHCSKDSTLYTKNNNGSLTFYPTPNVKRGTEIFDDILLINSSHCRSKTIEALSDYDKRIIERRQDICSFIQSADIAYAQHYPLLIKPEHIFLLILQGISVHVDKNAEVLRYKYVSHEGKKTLLVKTGPGFIRGRRGNDWDGVIKNFVQQIDKNTKEDVVPLFNSDFSTSTLTEKIAAKITLMSTCKHYFEYKMMRCICGFPEIQLDGTIDDWILLKQKVKELLRDKVTKSFGEQWEKSLLPILDRFIAAYKGDISMVFWNSMIYRGQWSYMARIGGYGRGGQVKKYKKFISGWINTLFPYIGSKNDENRWCFVPYSGDMSANKQYKGKEYNVELTKQLGPEPSDFPKGTAQAPVEWEYEGDIMRLQFVAGFTGFEQNKKSLQLTPTIGWYIQHEDK